MLIIRLLHLVEKGPLGSTQQNVLIPRSACPIVIILVPSQILNPEWPPQIYILPQRNCLQQSST